MHLKNKTKDFMKKQGFGQALTQFEFVALTKEKRHGFDAAYKLYADHVYSLALHILNDKDAACDILQQVFETLLMKVTQVRSEDSLGAWLKRTTINACMGYFRKSAKIDSSQNAQEALEMAGEHVAVQEALFKNEAQVLDYLARLPSIQRSVVYFYAVQGLKHNEIAPSLGIEEANSRQLYRRALKQLKSWLQ